ncbi:MAG: hypothetical protein JWN64_179 [Parcubacteria group bacterium]|nr:hypothetical protein [Parcubacteria group bacterium]
MLNGKPLTPLFTHAQAIGRDFVKGSDEKGPFVACRLRNRNPSALYGWYVLVSPEDLEVMKEYIWCGNICGKSRQQSIQIRRRRSVAGEVSCMTLNHIIWERMGRSLDGPVCRVDHLLDFRRSNLAFITYSSRRGVLWVRTSSRWEVRIVLQGKNRYVGIAPNQEEGYRMYNRYLRNLKADFPEDSAIQAMPYNDVEPVF